MALTTIKVTSSAANWIRDEQYQERKATGRTPSQSEIIEQLILQRDQNYKPPVLIPDKHRAAVEAFLAWLERAPEGAIEIQVRSFVLDHIGIPRK